MATRLAKVIVGLIDYPVAGGEHPVRIASTASEKGRPQRPVTHVQVSR